MPTVASRGENLGQGAWVELVYLGLALVVHHRLVGVVDQLLVPLLERDVIGGVDAVDEGKVDGIVSLGNGGGFEALGHGGCAGAGGEEADDCEGVHCDGENGLFEKVERVNGSKEGNRK